MPSCCCPPSAIYICVGSHIEDQLIVQFLISGPLEILPHQPMDCTILKRGGIFMTPDGIVNQRPELMSHQEVSTVLKHPNIQRKDPVVADLGVPGALQTGV